MHGNAKTILLVEDDDDIRNVAYEVLTQDGYFVHAVCNGDVALIILKEQVRFDLLFTDIVMPGLLNGIELAREAQRIQPGIRLLYTTGFALVGTQDSGALSGPVLPKPYRPSDLLARIGVLLREC